MVLPDEIIVDGKIKWVRSLDAPHRRIPGVFFECPCCRFPTLDECDAYEICYICGWEDDGQDDPFGDVAHGGPNYHLSITRARENFRIYREKCSPREDRSLCRDTEVEWAAKGLASAAFEAMKVTDDQDSLDYLWERIDDVHSFLSGMLSARVREYELKDRRR